MIADFDKHPVWVRNVKPNLLRAVRDSALGVFCGAAARVREVPWANAVGRRGIILWMSWNRRVENFRLWWRASGEEVVQVGAVSFRMVGRRDDHYFDALAVGRTFERA